MHYDAIEEIENNIPSGNIYKLSFISFIGDNTFNSRSFSISGTIKSTIVTTFDPSSSFRTIIYASSDTDPNNYTGYIDIKNNSLLGDNYTVYTYLSSISISKKSGNFYYNEGIKIFIYFT